MNYLKDAAIDCLKAWGRIPEIVKELYEHLKESAYSFLQLALHIILPICPPLWVFLAWAVKKYDQKIEEANREASDRFKARFGSRHQKL